MENHCDLFNSIPLNLPRPNVLYQCLTFGPKLRTGITLIGNQQQHYGITNKNGQANVQKTFYLNEPEVHLMQKYVEQLLSDIAYATENVSWPYAEMELNVWDWISDDEEDKTAPIRDLEEWTGVKKELLPPESMLNDEQLQLLLSALSKMLDAYNCCFVLQTKVPQRTQYAAIRDNFDQHIRVKRWHMGLFEMCKRGTEHGKCALGEYCQCSFYEELFKDMIDEDLTPEEERARTLEIEIKHIKRKFGDGWMKYYPYHLDKNYDDENGKPYDYNIEDEDWNEDDDDNWWR